MSEQRGAALILVLILLTAMLLPLVLSQHEVALLLLETRAVMVADNLRQQAQKLHAQCENQRRHHGRRVPLEEMHRIVSNPAVLDREFTDTRPNEENRLPSLRCTVRYSETATAGQPDHGYRHYYMVSLTRSATRYILTDSQWLIEWSGQTEDVSTAQRRWYQRTGLAAMRR